MFVVCNIASQITGRRRLAHPALTYSGTELLNVSRLKFTVVFSAKTTDKNLVNAP